MHCPQALQKQDELTAGVTDLDTSLTDVDRDDFTHFIRLAKQRLAADTVSDVVDDKQQPGLTVGMRADDRKGRRRHTPR